MIAQPASALPRKVMAGSAAALLFVGALVGFNARGLDVSAAVPEHTAVAGERITVPAGVEVTIVGGVATATPDPTATPSPTASPTATPTVAPTPTPVPTPTPTPTPPPSGGNPAFGTRPPSLPLLFENRANVTVSNVTIDGGTRDAPKGIGITIRNVTGTITIRDVDLSDLVGGIYIYGSSGTLIIENVRSRNIGDGTIGAGHSNHIQLAESSFVGAIRGNQFLGGRTEDMLSTWHSGGRGSGQELVIEGNRFQGLVADTATTRAWTSSSGTGVILSDGGGNAKNGWIVVRANTFLTPGQVGIQIIDGPGLQVYGNTIYGERRPKNNNPMTTWEGQPKVSIHDNRWCWTNDTGSQATPWFYGGGTVTGNVGAKDCAIDPATLRLTL